MTTKPSTPDRNPLVHISLEDVQLEGELIIPLHSKGIVIFAHGSGSSRHSPRNMQVAQDLQHHGIATLLVDLLSSHEDVDYQVRFDIELLTKRLVSITIAKGIQNSSLFELDLRVSKNLFLERDVSIDTVNERTGFLTAQASSKIPVLFFFGYTWVRNDTRTNTLPIGYFGASTGAAASLMAASRMPGSVAAVVSRGGRVDLAKRVATKLATPTLLMVGENDPGVLAANKDILQQLRCPKRLVIIPEATHLFKEHGALEQVAQHAAGWFLQYFTQAPKNNQTKKTGTIGL